MKVLDGIEGLYVRTPAKAKLYDGTIVECSVYSEPKEGFKKKNLDHSNDKPPTERYRDIIVMGCEEFGVKKEYIDWLKKLDV